MTTTTDHDACVADRAFTERVRGYVDSEIGEDHAFRWGLADLDESDLFHIREALHARFRKVASEQITDALSMSWHVRTIQRIGELVAAIEAVEKARGQAAEAQTKWRQAEQNRKYREEQAAMREKAAASVKRPQNGGSTH